MLLQKLKLAFLIIFTVVPLYSIVQTLTYEASVVRSMWLIDYILPYVPGFAFIYVSFIFLAPLGVIAVDTYEEAKKIGLAIFITVITSLCVFIIYPSTYPRPDIELSGISGWLMGIIHWVDKPNNTFPSVHVGVSFCSALGIWTARKNWLGAFATFWATLIAISTLFVKQHYAIDIIGGIIVALFGLNLANKLLRK